jgi:predicted nucleic acid-binding Zn ribbon protein
MPCAATTDGHRVPDLGHTARSHPGDNSVDDASGPLVTVPGTTQRHSARACGQPGTTRRTRGSVPRFGRCPQPASTGAVDRDTPADLRRRWSSPVCTVPMTTTTESGGGVIPEPERGTVLWMTPRSPRCAPPLQYSASLRSAGLPVRFRRAAAATPGRIGRGRGEVRDTLGPPRTGCRRSTVSGPWKHDPPAPCAERSTCPSDRLDRSDPT